MARRACTRRELLDQWRAIQDDLEDDDPSPSKQRRVLQAKEDWFSDSFDFLVNLPNENHIWCGFPDLMGPLLETFHNYVQDKNIDSPLKLIWKRVSLELGCCTQCVCQHHQAQESYEVEYQLNTVDPLLKVLRLLDEERVTEHLKEINRRIQHKEYDPKCHSAEVVSVMFEVLMFPVMLDDYSLSNEFQVFIEAVDDSYELTLSSNQQYPGVYALLFFRSGKARAIGLRLARYMGKLRRAADLEPLQPLLRKYIGFLEMEVLPSTLDNSRPRVPLERANVWLGIKTLLGFLEAPAFEDGILERYPVFLNIVLNHVSDDTSDFSCAVSCLKVSFEMLGCKLWLRTTLSPSVMRNTLLGHCFHTRNEKSHKEIFDLFLPFLQSLEALQDGEHEKQRRNILYFLLHQVSCSSNFSILMRKNACKIALLIVQRGYMMNPPSPPFECAHMWGPSFVSSLKDSSLHSSLRQPAFDLINVILISDASALISVKSNHFAASNIYMSNYTDADDDEDEQPFSCDVEEKDNCCWSDFSIQNKLTSQECKDWLCVPLLWFDTMVQVDCSMLPVSFSKAVFWALSHISLFEPESTSFSSLSIEDWLSSYAGDISSSFVWEIPKGADDGGQGKDSTNSVKLSQQCTLLLRTFKRFASHFIMQIERHELQKQWTWEPRMAESLILLLIDPNDNTRQAARGILEHVSKARGLTSGLQFLCSSASSLSAIFLGLRYALRLVQRNLLLVNFQSLHHLFFIMRKLLKEVVSSPQKSPNTLDSVKSLPEGGFLRQNCSNYSPGRALENSASVVDTDSWNKFSYVLSAITWPSIQKCIEEGKELINSKPCQMTNVRLLEMLPVVYERLNTYSSMPSGSMVTMMPDVLNLTWLSDLVEWGKSSLIVIIRHWRQCMLSLLEILKGSHSGIVPYIVATEAIISPDTILIDELKEKICSLIIMLSKEASGSIEGRIGEQLSGRPSLDKKGVDPKRCSVLERDEGAKPDHSIRDETVIVLSDDETEKMPSKKLANQKVLLDDRMESDRTSSLKEKVKPFPSRIFVKDSQLPLQKQGDHVLRTSSISSAVESTGSRSTGIPSKGIATEKGISKSSTASDTSVSLKIMKSSDKSGHHQSSSQSPLISDKGDSIVKEVIQDDENDPMECALDKSQRTILLTKPTVSAPRRQVVQLQLPTGNKSSSLGKTGTCVRRLKPPKLDSWYKDILEIDFFAVVGLSSADGDDNKMSNLKEVPLCFKSQNHYVDIFRPLVLEEFKAQLHSSFMENSSDDMVSGSLCILSVERIDDFLLVRGRPDGNGANMSRGFIENDLVLLTKDPLKSSSQNVHVLGKVERREKSDKNQSLILVIRFYLSNDSSRLNKVRRLLVERSKWFLSRIMSITPQLREFQALSSLHDIPILPVILNPVDCSPSYPESRNIQLGKLSQPLQKVLMSSFNDSQLQAISVAIGTLNSRNSELSLIQGPPGTGKTRTVVAIVSALLALPTMRKNYSSKFQTSDSKSSSIGCTNSRVKLSQSAAMARAWQDAAFARQVIKDSKKDSLGTTEHSSRGRILICAQSNAAVDELVSRLNEGLFGIDGKVYKPYIVRVGNAKTVHPNSLPFFIDTLVEQRLVEEVKNQTARNDMDAESSSSLRARLEKVVDNIRYYESKRAKLKDGDMMGKISFDDRPSKEDDVHEVSDEAIGIKLNMLYGQKRAICGDLAVSQAREKKLAEESKFLKHKVRKSILREAEIVLTTLSGCGGDIYGVCSESASAGRFGNFSEQTLFDVVIIDEAAQALEPATLIPLQLLKSNETKCLMVGDPKQLPATVLSNVASKFLYECSMFERLQRAGHPVVMLTEQYRMHPEICRFPSLHFYENKLLNGAQMASKSAPFHENHLLGPYMFFDIVDGHECHGKNTGFQSLFNDSEAEAATEILKFLKKRYPSEFGYKKIGIITPYRSQLSLLRSRFSSMFGPEVLSDIELNTVDGFQGREVDILVLSTVRASDLSVRSSSIGFVADVRRMNVALTRAKFSLWIVGNAKTLQTNLHWAALIHNAKERKLFVSVARPYSSIFGKVLSSSKGAASPILDSFSSKGKKDGRGKGDSSDIQHARASTVEVHTGKAKHASKKKDKHTGRHSEDYALTNLKVIQNLPKNSHQPLGVPEQDQGCSEDGKSMVAQRHTEGKITSKLNETNTEELRRDTIVKRGERAKVNIPLQKDSNTKSSLRKAKEARKLPEQHKSNKDQGDSSNLTRSEEGNLHQTKAIDKRKSTEFAKQDQLISSRKRQRDAVDSLLSSALISSKKPLSKNASVKKGP